MRSTSSWNEVLFPLLADVLYIWQYLRSTRLHVDVPVDLPMYQIMFPCTTSNHQCKQLRLHNGKVAGIFLKSFFVLYLRISSCMNVSNKHYLCFKKAFITHHIVPFPTRFSRQTTDVFMSTTEKYKREREIDLDTRALTLMTCHQWFCFGQNIAHVTTEIIIYIISGNVFGIKVFKTRLYFILRTEAMHGTNDMF